MTAGRDRHPPTILEVLVEDLDELGLLGLCAGFEDGAWRADALALNLIKWIADWALTYEEQGNFYSQLDLGVLAKAMNKVYRSTKPENRGEIGELLLHMSLRSFYSSQTAISKIYFKDSSNDTVKGFDAVHVVEGHDGQLELWLGESKFYSDLGPAIRHVLEELEDHLQADYLRLEFGVIVDKLDPAWPPSTALRLLLAPETSLDRVFAKAVIPVFLTYNSRAVDCYSFSDQEYREEVAEEFRVALRTFTQGINRRSLPRKVVVKLILLPLKKKDLLVAAFDRRLKAMQEGLT